MPGSSYRYKRYTLNSSPISREPSEAGETQQQDDGFNRPLYDAMKTKALQEPQPYEQAGRYQGEETESRIQTKQRTVNALSAGQSLLAKKQARNMVTAGKLNQLEGVGAIPASGGSGGSQLIAQAKKYLGTPYLWGGTDPKKGLDCSGLIQLAAKNMGISIPRTSAEQRRAGQKVANLSQAQPGDLVGKPGHIGIYLGNGMMLHSPRTGKNVEIVKLYFTPTDIRRIA